MEQNPPEVGLPTPTRWQRALPWIPRIVLGVLLTVELTTILGVFAVALYVGWSLVWGSPTREAHARSIVALINDNWKAFLLLGVLLFYRTVRTFLDEVEKAFGMERRRVRSQGTQAENPQVLQ